MKTKILSSVLVIVTVSLFGQESPQQKMERLSKEIEILVKTEKEALKNELQAVDQRVKSGEIDGEKAEAIKRAVSEASAKRIAEQVNERSNEISELTKEIIENALEDTLEDEELIEIEEAPEAPEAPEDDEIVNVRIPKHKECTNKRTVDKVIFAFGINNVIENGDLSTLDDSPYSVLRSNFIELGWGYKTALNKDSRLVNLFYGLTFQWKELKLFDNLYHEKVGGETVVVTHPENLKKSKLRTSQLVIPLGLEFDFSGKTEKDGKTYYHRDKGVKLGLGGYGGLRINTKQIIKYDEPRDQKKQKIVDDYNMNNLTYGLMGYLGYKDTSLYVKYDLHPLFKNTETTNVGIGVRFDF